MQTWDKSQWVDINKIFLSSCVFFLSVSGVSFVSTHSLVSSFSLLASALTFCSREISLFLSYPGQKNVWCLSQRISWFWKLKNFLTIICWTRLKEDSPGMLKEERHFLLHRRIWWCYWMLGCWSIFPKLFPRCVLSRQAQKVVRFAFVKGRMRNMHCTVSLGQGDRKISVFSCARAEQCTRENRVTLSVVSFCVSQPSGWHHIWTVLSETHVSFHKKN